MHLICGYGTGETEFRRNSSRYLTFDDINITFTPYISLKRSDGLSSDERFIGNDTQAECPIDIHLFAQAGCNIPDVRPCTLLLFPAVRNNFPRR